MSEQIHTGGSLELGEILLRTTRLEPEQLEQARVRQSESHERLTDILVEEGMLRSEEVLSAVAQQLDLPFHEEIDAEVKYLLQCL